MVKAITSLDVARRAQVSQSAVSRTFTPGASVSATTRLKVLAAAKELGYRPNAIARTLITRRSRMIGVVMAYLDNHFYPTVLETLSKRLQADGYHVLLFMSESGDADAMLREILQYQVDGIVMASATLSSALAKECADIGIPVVLFNRYVPSSPASSVISDNVQGGHAVARFLVEAGHQRIAFIAGSEDSSTNRDRETGFLRGLTEYGAACFARALGGYSFEGAKLAARTLISAPTPPDALFVANDHMAFAVIDVLRVELGMQVPEEVSVVGYDDVPEAAWGGYDLTTVRQPAEQMIEETVRILLGQIEQKEVKQSAAVIPAKLIVRGSARRPKSSE